MLTMVNINKNIKAALAILFAAIKKKLQCDVGWGVVVTHVAKGPDGNRRQQASDLGAPNY
jgi:hypothetical protein